MALAGRSGDLQDKLKLVVFCGCGGMGVFWATDQEFCVLTNETTSAWVGRHYGFATTEMMQMSLVACELLRPACRMPHAACWRRC